MYKLPSVKVQEKLRTEGMPIMRNLIDAVGTPEIKDFLMHCLDHIPLYFWAIPASLTGKNHPEWARTEGGLVKHTACAVHYAGELCDTFGVFGIDTDIVIAATILHDTLKYGIDFDPRYSPLHPFLPSVHYAGIRNNCGLESSVGAKIFRAIERHMGNIHSGTWQPIGDIKPRSDIELVVHLADYIASRHWGEGEL